MQTDSDGLTAAGTVPDSHRIPYTTQGVHIHLATKTIGRLCCFCTPVGSRTPINGTGIRNSIH